MIRLLDIELFNFLGWHHLKFELANQGLTYLVGLNGSGKSSVIAAILWAITGRCDRVETLDELVWREAPSAGAEVRLRLAIQSDSRTKVLCITRFRGHPSGKNGVVLRLGNTDITARHQRKADDIIAEYIPYDFEQLKQVLIFASESRFFNQLPESEQKRIIREYFHFDRFAKAGEEIKAEYRALSEQHTAAMMQLEYLKGQLAAQEKELRRQKQAYESAKVQQKVEATSLAKDRDKALKQRIKASKESEIWSAKLEAARGAAHRLYQVVLELDEVNQKHQEVRQTKSCPQCNRPFERSQVTKQLNDLRDRKRDLLRRVQELEEERGDIDGYEAKAKEAQGVLNGLDRQIRDIDASLRFVGDSAAALLDCCRSSRRGLKKTRAGLVAHTSLVEKLDRRLQYREWWKSGFSSRGIELEALDRVLPVVNREINAILCQLPTDKGVIGYELYTEGHHLRRRITGYPGATTYDGLSGGEKRRVDFAVCCGLYTFLPQFFNVLFLDEPFEGLDHLGIRDCLDILHDSGGGSHSHVLRCGRQSTLPCTVAGGHGGTSGGTDGRVEEKQSAAPYLGSSGAIPSSLNKESLFLVSHRKDLESSFRRAIYLTNKKGSCHVDRIVERADPVL